MELAWEGLQNNSNPKPQQKCQVRGSGRSPGQQDDGSLIGGWRWVGGRVLQPISVLRDEQAPPATCLISSTWNVVERNPLPQPKCCWLKTIRLPVSWAPGVLAPGVLEVLLTGRLGSWKLCLLGNSLLMGSTVCGVCINCSSETKYLPQITEGKACFGSHSDDTVHRGREGMAAGLSGAAGLHGIPVRSRERWTLVLGLLFFFFF